MIWLVLFAPACLPTPAIAAPNSFRNDVMAVLSKAGCNQGACHGNQNGKNGFRLSLRGEDPAFDFASLTHDMLGRRTDRLNPAESLILLKATASIPHEGGRRFARDSEEFGILARWIADGLRPDPPALPVLKTIEVSPSQRVVIFPQNHVQLAVRAQFADGSCRDVTRLAVFEVPNTVAVVGSTGDVQRQKDGETTILVRYLDRQATAQIAFVPSRPGFHWQPVPETNYIDYLVFSKLATLRMLPSSLSSDSVFLRRAYLDALGVLPSAVETRAFLGCQAADKRTRLIDRLLERPEFADFWALKWSDLLRNEEKVLDRKGVEVFHHWIRSWIADGKPLNEFAGALIAARGSTYSSPAANFYRAVRDPQTRAEATAQVFLGIRLQCARCHNHPFDRWTQDDYYSLAAFFARVRYKIVENRRSDRLDLHEFVGEQIVWMDRQGEVQNPRTGQTIRPRFPGDSGPELSAGADRLEALAEWIASPANPFFARTQVNRIWYHLLGRGLVEPNDDFRVSNPPSNAALLEALAQDFIHHQFDVRYLVRTIMSSRVYQLSAQPNATNAEDEGNFSHALLRPLQAEPMLDALAQATEVKTRFNGYPAGMRAVLLPGVQPAGRRAQASDADLFLRRFGKPERLLTCECERSDDTTLGQAFQMITGKTLNDMLSDPANRLGRLMREGKSNRDIVEELYLTCLCRFPRAEEQRIANSYFERKKNRRGALEDIFWGLLNVKEFVLRQ